MDLVAADINRKDVFNSEGMNLCDEGNFYIHSGLFKCVIGSHILFSMIAVCTNLWFFSSGYRKVYFHRNVKIIMAFSLFSNILHSIFTIFLQGTHLYLYLSSTSGCQVIIPVQLCLSLRQPMNIAMMSFVPINVAIVIERAIATIRVRNYEKCTASFGFHLSILAILTSIFIIFYSQHNTPLNGEELYCSAVNKYTQAGVTISSYFALALELAAILCYFLIWLVNYKKRSRLIFDVTTAYQVSENLASLKLLLPWILFHFVTFAFFNCAIFSIPLLVDFTTEKMTIRAAYAGVYIIPLYCVLSPLLLLWITRRQKKSRVKQLQRLSSSVADMTSYETYLKKQWY